jgi:hypothetical protein
MSTDWISAIDLSWLTLAQQQAYVIADNRLIKEVSESL